MKFIQYLAVVVSMMALAIAASAATLADHKAAIAAGMHKQWDQPDQKLEILIIVNEKEMAIVDWILGDKGGRALLRYEAEQDQWQTLMCGGGALIETRRLQQAGVSLPTAKALTQTLRVQEQSLPPDQKVLIDSFQGVIKFTQEKDQKPHAHE